MLINCLVLKGLTCSQVSRKSHQVLIPIKSRPDCRIILHLSKLNFITAYSSFYRKMCAVDSRTIAGIFCNCSKKYIQFMYFLIIV